jgi:hypothetical protein
VNRPNTLAVCVKYRRSTRPGSRTSAGGLNINVSTIPNIVAFAPMPSAKQSTAASVKPGLLASVRTA